MQAVREAVLAGGQAARAHADPLGRAAHQVPRGGVRLRMRRPQRTQEAPEEAHRREAVQVSAKPEGNGPIHLRRLGKSKR